jgi:hypothetical protein
MTDKTAQTTRSRAFSATEDCAVMCLQGTWQPAGYHPQGYAQPAPPQGYQNGQQNVNDHAQQGCGSMLPMIMSGIKYLMRNKQLISFIKSKFQM